MLSCATIDILPGDGPASRGDAEARPPEASLAAVAALSRLAADLVASSPGELARGWLGEAARRLPVRALHLALREGEEMCLWSSAGEAPANVSRPEIEQDVAAGAPTRTSLDDGPGTEFIRLTMPVSGGGSPIGALVADVAPAAEADAAAALEALRWPLGIRLSDLMGRASPPGTATSPAAHRLWSQMQRCQTLTDLLSLLVSALPGLLGADWAAVATCDPQGRLLHVTSLDTGSPVDPEAWARAVEACATDGEDAPRPAPITFLGGGTGGYAWAVPLRADRGPLRYVLVVGDRGDHVGRTPMPLLAEVAAHAQESLARVLVVGELRLALDAQQRVRHLTQVVASLSHDARPEQALAAVMDAILRDAPGVRGSALHLWAGEELVHEQIVGAVPAELWRGVGLRWWQARLMACASTCRPECAPLPEPAGEGTMLVTVPILAGGANGDAARALGVVSLFATSLEAVDVALRAALRPFAHIIAPLVQNLQRHRALERASRELEQRRTQIIESKGALEAILDGFPDGLFIVDRDLRVTLSNEVQMQRIQGSGPSAGQFCWELYGSGNGVCPGCRIMDTLRKGISTRRRTRVRRPGQPEREWEVATHPIARRSARSTRAALVIVRDVTEQEQVAKSLAQVEKLAAVGRLAAGIAHEINNPLAAILANVQLLLGSTARDDERFESLDIVRRSAERARRVVRNLLSFSGPSPDSLTPVDVNASIRAALDLMSHQARQRGVNVECRLAEALPPVMASREQLESVWLNLALNALDAVLDEKTPGRIEVTSEVAPGEQVRVVVRDNGPGIPPQRLPHVFEPFGSNPSPTAGTGLGLFSCHHAVKHLGGSIHARAGEGGGVAFEVVLPATVAADTSPPITSGADSTADLGVI